MRGGLLFIKLLTPLHVGSSETGIIDRPIQRDHLGLPIIFGSSLKGALRHQLSLEESVERFIFGQRPEEGEEKLPGSVLFLDARPLFVPVRSLIGGYAYVTSPFLLRKLIEYSEIAGVDLGLNLDKLKELGENEVVLLNQGNKDIYVIDSDG